MKKIYKTILRSLTKTLSNLEVIDDIKFEIDRQKLLNNILANLQRLSSLTQEMTSHNKSLGKVITNSSKTNDSVISDREVSSDLQDILKKLQSDLKKNREK